MFKPWYIWYDMFRYGMHFGSGFIARPYKFKLTAWLAVKKMERQELPDNLRYDFHITQNWPPNNELLGPYYADGRGHV